MAFQEIALKNDGGAFEVQTVLDGATFWLNFRFNARGQYWTMGLYDAARNPVYVGVRCVADYPLLAHCSEDRQPLGTLIMLDTAGNGEDPGFTDLGRRCVLIYQTVDD